jgi:hypothetical protein
MLRRQRLHRQRRFLCDRCSIKGKQAISSSKKSCFEIVYNGGNICVSNYLFVVLINFLHIFVDILLVDSLFVPTTIIGLAVEEGDMTHTVAFYLH